MWHQSKEMVIPSGKLVGKGKVAPVVVEQTKIARQVASQTIRSAGITSGDALLKFVEEKAAS